MSWSRHSNVPDGDPDAPGEHPLADNIRLSRPRRSVAGEPVDDPRSDSIFDQQTVVDNNFVGRSQARRERQTSRFNTQQIGSWAAEPGNSQKLMAIGAAIVIVLLLIAAVSLYNRMSAPAEVSEDPAIGFGAEAPADAGAIINPDPLASAPTDPGLVGEPVPAVPNTDPVQPAPAAPGGFFAVTGTATEGLFLRQEPSTTANILGTLPEGTRVESLGEELNDGTRTWLRVRTEQFGEGWTAMDFLQPAP